MVTPVTSLPHSRHTGLSIKLSPSSLADINEARVLQNPEKIEIPPHLNPLLRHAEPVEGGGEGIPSAPFKKGGSVAPPSSKGAGGILKISFFMQLQIIFF